jgi:hypothetical protein
MPTVYKIDVEGAAPVPVECEVPGYPNRDADGEVMCDNSHFATLAEAWDAQLRDTDAHVMLAGQEVARLRERLSNAQADAGRAAERFVAARIAHRDWLAATTEPEPAA